jgi:hypothetical protein
MCECACVILIRIAYFNTSICLGVHAQYQYAPPCDFFFGYQVLATSLRFGSLSLFPPYCPFLAQMLYCRVKYSFQVFVFYSFPPSFALPLLTCCIAVYFRVFVEFVFTFVFYRFFSSPSSPLPCPITLLPCSSSPSSPLSPHPSHPRRHRPHPPLSPVAPSAANVPES